MNIGKCLTIEKLSFPPYEMILTPLNERCSSLKVEVVRGEVRFEQIINVYDFVDIKQMLKAGKTMEEINQLSLLFLKLIISSAHQTKKLKLVQITQVPFRKLIKDKTEAEKIQRDKGEAKGILLHAKEDLFIVIPKLLVIPPQPKAVKQQKDSIKSLFFN